MLRSRNTHHRFWGGISIEKVVTEHSVPKTIQANKSFVKQSRRATNRLLPKGFRNIGNEVAKK